MPTLARASQRDRRVDDDAVAGLWYRPAMNWEGLAFQAVDGLASASGLFFVAAGLSLIFGVTRIINIAHGSLYMLGTYIAVTLGDAMDGALGFWGGIVAAALIVGVLGALIEIVLLRRIYRAPELFQLLATFALLLVINDAALWLWGPEDLLGPRAPGLRGAVELLGRRCRATIFPDRRRADRAARAALLLARTRFGRAGARGDAGPRDGRRARRQSGGVVHGGVRLGSVLAGLGGALQVAREPANLGIDLTVISDAFVVVVVGGMGSIPGAYLAAVSSPRSRRCASASGVVDLGGVAVNFSKLTLVAEFLVMAVVLIARPYGPARAPAGRRAQRAPSRRRRSARPRAARSLFGAGGLAACVRCRFWRAARPICWCSASMC